MNRKKRVDNNIDYYWSRTKINREYVDACLTFPDYKNGEGAVKIDNSRPYIHYGLVFSFEL